MPHPDLLLSSHRCLLAYGGKRWPVVVPMAYWSDGTALWMTASHAATKTQALRRDPRCSVYVAPRVEGEVGVRINGRARVFGSHDPVGLALHAPTVSTAVGALSLKHLGSVLGHVRDAPRISPPWLPIGRVVVKVAIDRLAVARAVPAGQGIAPPLPPVVPADVRRALGGRRDVVLVTADGADAIELGPAVWGAGFTVDPGPVWTPREGPATVVLDVSPDGRPTSAVGVRLSGRLAAGRLTPEHATWWHGFEIASAEVPARSAGVVLPD